MRVGGELRKIDNKSFFSLASNQNSRFRFDDTRLVHTTPARAATRGFAAGSIWRCSNSSGRLPSKATA